MGTNLIGWGNIHGNEFIADVLNEKCTSGLENILQLDKRIKIFFENGIPAQTLTEMVLTPARKSRNIPELLVWEDQTDNNKMFVKLVKEPKADNHLFLREQFLDLREDLKCYKLYKRQGCIFLKKTFLLNR